MVDKRLILLAILEQDITRELLGEHTCTPLYTHGRVPPPSHQFQVRIDLCRNTVTEELIVGYEARRLAVVSFIIGKSTIPQPYSEPQLLGRL